MKLVVIVNGFPRAGKDTAIDFMSEHLANRHGETISISSIDGVRNMLLACGFPVDKKGPDERKLLSEIGIALEEYNDYRTNDVVQQACDFFRWEVAHDKVAFVHMREPHLIEKVKAKLYFACPYAKFRTVFLANPRVEAAQSNPSDANVGQMTYDHMLVNDSDLTTLQERCISLIDWFSQRAVAA